MPPVPHGALDDAVDVVSLFCLALDLAHPAILRTPVTPRTMGDLRIDFIERPEPGSYEAFAKHEGAIDQKWWDSVGPGGLPKPAQTPIVELTRWSGQPSQAQAGRTYSDVDRR